MTAQAPEAEPKKESGLMIFMLAISFLAVLALFAIEMWALWIYYRSSQL